MRAKPLAALAALFATASLGGGIAVADPDRGRSDHRALPDSFGLPDGWRPEGIAASRHRLYVGSIPTGSVLTLNPRTGDSHVVVPPHDGRAAIGLKLKAGKLFVAGGPTGNAFVYDARSGADVAEFQLAPSADTFINDVVVTRGGAYFTDSRRAVLYVVARDLSGARELALPDIPIETGNNLNGIAATEDGEWLLAVQTNTGALWRIDPETGGAIRVDLGTTSLTAGDGLLLEGRKLYVVQNRLNQIAVIRLSDDFTRGSVVKTITHPKFDVPTTVARLGKSLYLPNARFGITAPETAEYSVTRVKAPGGHHHHHR